MENTTVYLLVALLLSLSITISVIACVFCRRWREAYRNIKCKYNNIKKENIRLQHDVYRLTYITPDVETKKGEN